MGGSSSSSSSGGGGGGGSGEVEWRLWAWVTTTTTMTTTERQNKRGTRSRRVSLEEDSAVKVRVSAVNGAGRKRLRRSAAEQRYKGQGHIQSRPQALKQSRAEQSKARQSAAHTAQKTEQGRRGRENREEDFWRALAGFGGRLEAGASGETKN